MLKGYEDKLNTKQIDAISNKIKELDQNNQLATMSATELGEALTQSVGGASGILTKIVGSVKAMIPDLLANVAIMAVIAGFSKIYKTFDEHQQKVIEAGEEATKKIKEQRQAYQDNAKYIKQYSDRYTQLSKGINASGDNVSLTTSEFEELQNIQNELANRFPELVAGYDEFGNAILKAGTNAQTLTEALREQKDEMYESTISSSKDVIEGFKQQSKFAKGFFDDVQSGGLYKEAKAMYEALQNGQNYRLTEGAGKEANQLIEELDLDLALGETYTVSFEELSKHAQEITSMYKQYKTEANETANSMREVGQAYLHMNDSFKHLSSDQQSILSTAIDSLSFEFFDEKAFENGTEVDLWISKVLDTIQGSKLQDEFEQVFTLDPKSITKANYDSIMSSIYQVGTALQMDGDILGEFKKSFQLDPKQLNASYELALGNVLRSIPKGIQKVKNEVGFKEAQQFEIDAKINEDQIIQWLQGLTAQELDIVAKLKLDGTETIEELENLINGEIFHSKSLSEFETEVSNIISGYGLIATATSELSQSSKLTSDTESGLKAAFGDLDGVLVRTANGIRINNEEMRKLSQETAEATLVELAMKEAMAVDEYQKKAKELKNLTDEHKGLKEALETGELEKYQKALEGTEDALSDYQLAHARNLYSSTTTLAKEIDGYDQLELQIRQATSALNQWIIAKETANASDNIKTAASGIEEAQTALNNRAIGTDEYRSYMDYIGTYAQNDNNYTVDAQKWINRAKQYMTTDSSGNLTGTGFDRFMNLISASGVDLSKGFNIEEIAKATNFTSEFVMDMLWGAQDFGYNLNFENMSEGIISGMDAIDTNSADARTSLETFRKEIDHLASKGADVSELEAAYDEVYRSINAKEMHTSIDVTTASFEELKGQALESGEAIKQVFSGTGIGFDFNLSGLSTIEDYDATLANFKEYKLSLDVNSEEYEHVQNIIAYLITAKQQLNDGQWLSFDVSQYSSDMQHALGLIEQYRDTVNQIELNQEVGLDTYDLEMQKGQLITEIEGLDPQIKSDLEINDDQASLQSQIDGLIADPIKVKATLDTNYLSEENGEASTTKAILIVGNRQHYDATMQTIINDTSEKIAQMQIDGDPTKVNNEIKSAINKIETSNPQMPIGADLTQFNTDIDLALSTERHITIRAQVLGLPSGVTVQNVNGTAHVSGTALNHFYGSAFAGGNWGLPHDVGTSLVGELGTEILVRNGAWFPIGEHGAEMIGGLKRGDIIFNHKQSEQLLKYGHVTAGGGRGRAFARGTIPAGGRAFGSEDKEPLTSTGNVNAYITADPWIKNHSTYTSSYGSSGSGGSGGNSGGSSGNSGSDSEAEKLDWIERKIKDIERDIENLDQTAQATYKSWSTRNEALVAEMSKVTEEIDIQKKAYDRYMQEAYSVGLSDEYANKVMDGTIDIESIGDEDLRNKISEFQEWYDKAVDCADAVQDLEDNLAELAQQKFDNVMQQFDDLVSTIEHSIEMIEGGIDQLETAGYLVSKQAYEDLRKQQSEHLLTEEKRLAALKIELENAMKAGDIVEGSEAWYEMKQDIYDTEAAIQELNTALIETDNEIRQIEWDRFEMAQDRKDRITAESEFLLGLMENEDKFNKDNGRITNYGRASQGLHAVNYNTEMNKVDAYTKMIKDLEDQLAQPENLGNQILQEKLDEYVDARYEAVEAAEAEKDAILEIIREGYDNLLDIMDKAISKKTELLQLEKEQADYEKSIADKAKEVMNLERQVQAYSTDTSEEGIAAAQKIKVQLEEAKYDLESTEMDRYIQETEQLLTTLQDDTSEWIDNRMDQEAELLRGVITSTNQNAQTIKETLETEVDAVGIKLSEQMASIWATGGVAQTVVAEYGVNFGTQLTTTNAVLTSIEELVREWSKIGDDKYEDSKKDPDPVVDNTPSTPPATPTTPPQESDDQKEKDDSSSSITVGSKINAGSARIYANSKGTGGGTQYFANDPIYTVIGEENGYVRVRWHKASSGSTGWFKKSDVKAYSTGGLIDYDGLAQVHGGKKPELVLNAKDTENFIALKDVLQRIDSQDLMLRQEELFSLQDAMRDMAAYSKEQFRNMTMDIPRPSRSTDQNISIQIGDIQMYGVNDPETFATQLKETLKNNVAVKKIIQADTLGVMTGKNTLTKLKYV